MDRWLRLILRAYPRALREHHGEDVLRFWRAQSEERRYRGVRGRLALLASLAGDAARSHIRASTTRGWEGRTMGGWTTDLRHARRALAGAPFFTAVAVGTLALGVGAATAVFSVVEGVVLRPLPYPASDRLVLVRVDGETDDVSWPDFRDWRERSADFLDLAGYAEDEGTFTWEGGAEALTGARVTHDWFEVMGVAPELGRVFTEEEDRADGPAAVILSHGLWVERFGGDVGVLGRTVPLGGASVPVVGVMPRGFDAPYAGTRFWTALREDALLAEVGLPTGSRSLGFISVVARLRGPLAVPSAEARLQEVVRGVDDGAGKRADQRHTPTLVLMLDDLVGGVRDTLVLLLAAAGLVLLVAAVNVAGLALGRAAVRAREMAVRTALGAPRARIARQVMTESLLVSSVAGLLGLGLARAFQRLLVLVAPEGLPRLEAIRLDGATLVFWLGATAASGLVFGLLPAARAVGAASSGGELTGGRGASVGRHALRSQRLLVSVQVAVAVVLLTGAALLASSFARLVRVDPGFRSEGVTIASVSPDEERYPGPDALDAFWARVLGAVRAIPGVVSASTTYSPPMAGSNFRTSVVPEGQEEDRTNRRWVGSVVVGDDYFATTGVPILEGRGFTAQDRLGEPPVAVVNEAMARELWPGEDALGKRFTLTGGIGGTMDGFDPAHFFREPFTVVGVARDVRRIALDQPPAPEYYRPHAQLPWGFQFLVVRADGSVPDLAGLLRAAVWGIDPTVPVRTVRPLATYVARSAAEARFRTLLLGVFAGLTGLLAVVGLYAVMALAVARRTREMGIRLALGAPRGAVVRGVLAGGLRLAGTGAVVGLAVAWYGSRVLQGMLYQVTATDPSSYVGVAALTVLVSIVSSWGPARRAGRVDPVTSLRPD